MQFLFLFNRILELLFIFIHLEFTNSKLSVWLLYLVLFVIILFIYLFWAVLESSLLCRLFSSCGARVSHCSGFSFCGVQALELTGFSSSSTWAP